MSKRGRWKLSWNWCPTRLLRCLQVQPAEVYTPVGDTLLVSNGLKGNGHFKDIPVVIALHLRAPLVVPTEVYLRAFVHDTIPLGAGCVGAKGESVGLIVKRVNEHKKVVVVTKREIPLQRFDDVPAWQLMKALRNQVEVVVVISHPHIGTNFCLTCVHRKDHVKVCRHFRVKPGLFVHHAVYTER